MVRFGICLLLVIGFLVFLFSSFAALSHAPQPDVPTVTATDPATLQAQAQLLAYQQAKREQDLAWDDRNRVLTWLLVGSLVSVALLLAGLGIHRLTARASMFTMSNLYGQHQVVAFRDRDGGIIYNPNNGETIVRKRVLVERRGFKTTYDEHGRILKKEPVVIGRYWTYQTEINRPDVEVARASTEAQKAAAIAAATQNHRPVISQGTSERMLQPVLALLNRSVEQYDGLDLQLQDARGTMSEKLVMPGSGSGSGSKPPAITGQYREVGDDSDDGTGILRQ